MTVKARVQASSDVAGAGMGGVIGWLWNGYDVANGHPEMPLEVAMLIAPIIGRIIKYAVAWLPHPDNGDA